MSGRALALSFVAVATAACASTASEVVRSDGGASAPVSAAPVASTGPTTSPSAATSVAVAPTNAAGAATYQRACAICHDSPWRVSRGPGLHGLERPEAYVREKIRTGSGNAPGMAVRMPAIGPESVSDAELEDLIEFLRSLTAIAR